MTGLINLEQLLKNMEPQLSDEEYVFCSISAMDFNLIKKLQPISFFQEDEGTSLILEKQIATNAGIEFDSSFKQISLKVHSSLEAVGLTAAISTALAEDGISANIIAAYYHDHIFVPSINADLAMSTLERLSQG